MSKDALIFWFTGLSGAGKTTLATQFHDHLLRQNLKSCILDGDVLRTGLCQDLGFSPEDRSENLRRASETAKILANLGHIVICAFITPFQEDRDHIKSILGSRYHEIYIQCDLSLCEERDTKGLYKKARNGEITSFTGIDSPFDEPTSPDLVIHTGSQSIESSLEKLSDYFLSLKTDTSSLYSPLSPSLLWK